MADKLITIYVLALSCFLFSGNVRATRIIGTTTKNDLNSLLTERNGSAAASYWDCWNALMEIRSCSNEIVSFFLNGKAEIGESCCKSISIITHQCWPNMLASLGFTPAEGNLLSGFCDKGGQVPSIAPEAAPPAQSKESEFIVTMD